MHAWMEKQAPRRAQESHARAGPGKDLRAEKDRMRGVELPEVTAEDAAREQADCAAAVVLHLDVPEVVFFCPQRAQAVPVDAGERGNRDKTTG